MNTVICGASEIGGHVTKVLGDAGHDITIIDQVQEKLSAIEDVLDVRTLRGNGAQADVLREAGVDRADMYIAATDIDEINLLTASIAKAVGARRTVARVHHSAYFEQRGLDYSRHLGIDHLLCPEHSTAVAIAQTLRNPGAMAVERFARGQIEMQQFQIGSEAKAVGNRLSQIEMPCGARLAAIERDGTAFIPTGDAVVNSGDIVTLVGEVKSFERARKMFIGRTTRRHRVMIMGGTTMGVWLCRALHSSSFTVKVFVPQPQRAEELAEKLDWVTVLCAHLDDPALFEEEQIHQADVFIALTDDDEHNILGAARAKSMGAQSAIAVLNRATYMHLLKHVGIDRAFSPRDTATSQVQQWLDDSPVRHLASLAVGIADLYEVHSFGLAPIVDTPLRDLVFPQPIIVAAIERGDRVFVPGGDDKIVPGDRVVIAGPRGIEKQLKKVFRVK